MAVQESSNLAALQMPFWCIKALVPGMSMGKIKQFYGSKYDRVSKLRDHDDCSNGQPEWHIKSVLCIVCKVGMKYV